jgi:hypothetical protein
LCVRGVWRSLRRSHIQGRIVVQVLLRRLLSPLNRAPRVSKIKKLRCRSTTFITTFRGRSRQKFSSGGCVRRPKILNLRSNQNSATYPKFPIYLHPLRHLRSLRRCLRRCLRRRLSGCGASGAPSAVSGGRSPPVAADAEVSGAPSAISGGGSRAAPGTASTGVGSGSGSALFNAPKSSTLSPRAA